MLLTLESMSSVMVGVFRTDTHERGDRARQETYQNGDTNIDLLYLWPVFSPLE